MGLATGCLTLALLLAACGGSSAKSTPSATQAGTSPTPPATTQPGKANTASTTTTASSTTAQTTAGAGAAGAPKNKFQVSSPVVPARGALPVRYTCDGADTSLPLRWSNVPAGTKELMLFIANGSPKGTVLHWAVTNLKPRLGEIAAGKLPPGAIVGRNSTGRTGYSLCPPKGPLVDFGVGLFALSKHVAVKPGFNGVALLERIERNPRIALTVVSYKRR